MRAQNVHRVGQVDSLYIEQLDFGCLFRSFESGPHRANRGNGSLRVEGDGVGSSLRREHLGDGKAQRAGATGSRDAVSRKPSAVTIFVSVSSVGLPSSLKVR